VKPNPTPAPVPAPASGPVWCGGHEASSCPKCPDNNGVDMGKNWCNGDCQWTKIWIFELCWPKNSAHSVTGPMIDDGTMEYNGVPLHETPLGDRPLIELDFASQGQGLMVLALAACILIVCSITLCWCYRFVSMQNDSKVVRFSDTEHV